MPMKRLKTAAKIIGVIWMMFFGISVLSTLGKHQVDLSSTYGLGYLFGVMASKILILSIGLLLFFWGKRPIRTSGKSENVSKTS
jgi:hypothetical protein